MKDLKRISVKAEILKYFENRAKKRYKLPTIGKYFPSVLCQSCTKAQFNYYMMAMREGRFSESSILHMGEGTVMHEIIQTFPFWDGVEVPARMAVNTGNEKILIRGRADAVLGDTVYDFKRVSRIPFRIKFDHALQLNFYMECLGKPKGIVVYVGYDANGNFDVVERYWVLSDWHTNHLINRAINLHTLLKNNQTAYCSCRNRRHDVEWEHYLKEKEKK